MMVSLRKPNKRSVDARALAPMRVAECNKDTLQSA